MQYSWTLPKYTRQQQQQNTKTHTVFFFLFFPSEINIFIQLSSPIIHQPSFDLESLISLKVGEGPKTESHNCCSMKYGHQLRTDTLYTVDAPNKQKKKKKKKERKETDTSKIFTFTCRLPFLSVIITINKIVDGVQSICALIVTFEYL